LHRHPRAARTRLHSPAPVPRVHRG
jgi:hypothetical protein